MKTYFLEIDNLEPQTFKQLLGFILTVGLNFRKIQSITGDKTNEVLVVETLSRIEQKALKKTLEELNVLVKFIVESDNKAKKGSKELGSFTEVVKTDNASSYFLDKTTGKRFNVVRKGL